MSFSAMTLRNLLRQRTRTLLTVLGIAIGITTVVALGSVVGGLRDTSTGFISAGGADFLVAQNGASDLTFSTVPVGEWRALQRRPDVARASGALLDVTGVGGNAYFPIFGYDLADLRAEPLQLLAGRLPRTDAEAIAGAGSGKAVGSTIEAKGLRFRVVGRYRLGNRMNDAGAIVSLAAAERLTGKHGVVTAIHVTVRPGHDPAAVAAAIEHDFPTLAAIRGVGDYSKVDQGYKVLDAVNLAISLLAVGIGAIGVMNTMIMSVYERTREIGILRAVGWRGSRIVRMVVSESLFLCLIAAVLGTALGVLASRSVLLVPSISSLIAPAYPAEIFVRAVAVGVLVALVGALYPAIRAVRLSPMEALRHE